MLHFPALAEQLDLTHKTLLNLMRSYIQNAIPKVLDTETENICILWRIYFKSQTRNRNEFVKYEQLSKNYGRLYRSHG